MKKKRKIGRPRLRLNVTFPLVPTEVALLDTIRTFYVIKNRAQTLRYLLTLSTLDIASLPENSEWDGVQRESWTSAREFAKDFHRCLLLSGCKRVLDKSSPETKMSVDELLTAAKKEIEDAGTGPNN